MRRALVALNTELPPLDVWKPWLAKADLVVGADGGGDRLLALGIEPDVVVGDLDSVLGSTRRRLGKGRLVRRTADNDTDLEKALDHCAAKKITDITIVSGRPDRLDHVLGQMALLLSRSKEFRMRYVDDDFIVEPVRRAVRFRAPVGTLVSLFSPSTAKGVTTRGLRWVLQDATLPRGTRGLHNEVAANPVEVSLREGELLLFRGHRVDPHA